jgi:glycosyltransferase involved in cell wall biosynthesis
VLDPASAIDAPLSVLEAMACNLPIVTTPFGALPNMFKSGHGIYYGDTEERLLGLVQLAVEERDCTTVEKVAPYSWDRAASMITETLTERCHL